MKKSLILLLFTLIFLFKAGLIRSQAQEGGNHEILVRYYSIKNALISSNVSQTVSEAIAFGKVLGKFELKQQPTEVQTAIRSGLDQVLKASAAIAASKDLAAQREQFAVFSDAMIRLARHVKLSNEPVYIDYCPMKKSSWLSAEKLIRNPYYGSSMLTCGKITDTLK